MVEWQSRGYRDRAPPGGREPRHTGRWVHPILPGGAWWWEVAGQEAACAGNPLAFLGWGVRALARRSRGRDGLGLGENVHGPQRRPSWVRHGRAVCMEQ